MDEPFLDTTVLPFVLVDKKKQIRGFYDGTNPEDIERLIIDIKLLKNDSK